MIIEIDKRIESAFKNGFYTNRSGTVIFIDPKKKRISFTVSSDGFEIDEFHVTIGSGWHNFDTEGYGTDWALTKEELKGGEVI